MKRTIGTCSVCGGPVTTYEIWHGIFPPPLVCEHCGATGGHGPVIPMTPKPVPTQPYYTKTLPYVGGDDLRFNFTCTRTGQAPFISAFTTHAAPSG